MNATPVPATLRQLPNALTIVRFAAVPVFAIAFLAAGDGAAWGAGFLFGGAAITDQIDGWLARRWHVESRFGRIADPLADRLMISVAAVLLWHEDRIPWPAALIILSRDLLLVVGYKLLAPRGLEVEVTRLGKVATWVLYFGVAMVIVTDKGTDWPVWVLWLGIALSLGAAAQYVSRARRVALQGRDGAAGGEGPPVKSQVEVDP
jgi:CDP-diacylglycerol--glycerol-3-phosphate 3-phosphatidyltransferase